MGRKEITDVENVYDVLKARGYIAQVTNETAVREALAKPGVTFYIGFDPTADSLHVGHFVTMMVMAHMQRAGHRPIALMGGGTGMIGDPSGRTDLRQILTPEAIQHNVDRFKEQMKILVDFTDDQAIMANNADWLLDLNYIDFLRDIGSQFSVNRMLTAECYKQRLERGLTFLEFNYMLMQAFDFLQLNRRYGCTLELGGDDQWSNILAGIDLTRRKEGKEVLGLTMNLLTTSEGIKMGKTAKGALWLDPDKCAPYDFYQYWRNIGDADVEKCLRLLTFMPLEEIEELTREGGSAINQAKKRLAYEVTAIVHGKEAARSAEQQAADLFEGGGVSSQMPVTSVDHTLVAAGQLSLLDVLMQARLFPSRSEARRLFQQGGVYLNGEVINDFNYQLTAADFNQGFAVVKRGKKIYHRLTLDS
ncbi:tyrosine--tRNA ligase [Oscillospiraceae bacterium HV4-5-C5C]|nr:tyrosine--tRNA ligase [Oscillospiraceae bacterium HV4-5-C5C]